MFLLQKPYSNWLEMHQEDKLNIPVSYEKEIHHSSKAGILRSYGDWLRSMPPLSFGTEIGWLSGYALLFLVLLVGVYKITQKSGSASQGRQPDRAGARGSGGKARFEARFLARAISRTRAAGYAQVVRRT